MSEETRDRLAMKLELLIGSESLSVPVEYIRIAATTYGFDAEATFAVSSEIEDDPVFASFVTSDLIKAKISVANGALGYADEEAQPLAFVGYVTERRLRETFSDRLTGEPVVGRRFTIGFADPAQVFWRQHRPLELYTGASMQEVIEQHTTPGMQLTFDWPKLAEAYDVLCIGLGGEAEASFYDFVVGFIHAHHGVLELTPSTGEYRFGATKTRGLTAVELEAEAVREIRVLGPEPARHATTVFNPFTEAPLLTKAVANEHAITGVVHGLIERTAVATRFDDRVKTEEDRVIAAGHHIEIQFRRSPPTILPPGGVVKLGDEFSDKRYPFRKKYRIIALNIEARAAPDQDEGDLSEPSAKYDLDMRARLELEGDPTPNLPAFLRPSYPVLVEGKVLSASGTEVDRTWHAMEGESDSLHRYRINVPLWNKNVLAPFDPNAMPGHFFFPAYKNQRVLVALHFDAAFIRGYLDWAQKLAADTQGDQIVLGKRDKDETIVKHIYEDDKPVLQIQRRLVNDVQTIRVSEGTIRFEVKELDEPPSAEPSYDLRPTVTAAKEEIGSNVRGSIGEVTGTFGASMGAVTTSLQATNDEVDGALSAAEAELIGKIEQTEAQLKELSSSGMDALAEAVGAIEAAKAEILQALYT